MPVTQKEDRPRSLISATAKLPVSGSALMSRGLGVGLEGELASAMIELWEAD